MDSFWQFVDWLQSIPVICLIGLLYAVAFLLLPFAQWVYYRRLIKKYGKKYADEIVRRM